jgi:hypothetical protein
MSAPAFAWGAISLNCSVTAKIPNKRNAVKMTSSENAQEARDDAIEAHVEPAFNASSN